MACPFPPPGVSAAMTRAPARRATSAVRRSSRRRPPPRSSTSGTPPAAAGQGRDDRVDDRPDGGGLVAGRDAHRRSGRSPLDCGQRGGVEVARGRSGRVSSPGVGASRHAAIIAHPEPVCVRADGPRCCRGPGAAPRRRIDGRLPFRPKWMPSSRAAEGPGPATPRQPECDPDLSRQVEVRTRCQCPSDEEMHVDFVSGLRCRECGRAYPAEALHVCDFCFGPLEVDLRLRAGGRHHHPRADRRRDPGRSGATPTCFRCPTPHPSTSAPDSPR